MQKYETIFVVDSLLKTEEIEDIITKYERFVSANGGEINAIEKWGKKRLAYEIKKRQYGYYVLIRFDGPGSMIKQLEREYRLNELILRYMTLQLSKQALKALDKQPTFAPSTEETRQPATLENKKPETEVETPSEPEEAEEQVIATEEKPVIEDSEENKKE